MWLPQPLAHVLEVSWVGVLPRPSFSGPVCVLLGGGCHGGPPLPAAASPGLWPWENIPAWAGPPLRVLLPQALPALPVAAADHTPGAAGHSGSRGLCLGGLGLWSVFLK